MGIQRAIELRDSTSIGVANNYVCRNAAGVAIGTCLRGILVQGGGSHTIGSWYLSGTRFSQGNVIANSRVGIELAQTTGNTVEANTIEDNTGVGVLVSSSSANAIGSLYDTALGASLGNIIRRNGSGSVPPRGGIVVAGGAGNAILRNSISENAPLGIDLGGDGVTANDVNDADAGANGLQNHPVLSSAVVGPTTTVTGTLASLASRGVRVQIFRSSAVNASGHAEGQVYLGETMVATDATGHATFAASLPTVAVGAIVSVPPTVRTMSLVKPVAALVTPMPAPLNVPALSVRLPPTDMFRLVLEPPAPPRPPIRTPPSIPVAMAPSNTTLPLNCSACVGLAISAKLSSPLPALRVAFLAEMF